MIFIAMLCQEVWDDEVVGYKKFFSPKTNPLPYPSWGPEVVLVGKGTGIHNSTFLFPTKED
jgi:hypothetical protein